MVHLDAILYVVDGPESLPDPGTVQEFNAKGGTQIHPACLLTGPGFRVAVLLPDWEEASTYDAIEAIGSLQLIQVAVSDAGGCAIPIAPHQDPDGEVLREIAQMAPNPEVGIVTMLSGGSTLGRDLDVEHAGRNGRKILGGTGPFGDITAYGKFSTLLPANASDCTDIIRCLNTGFGFAVEVLEVGAVLPREPRRGGRGRNRGNRGNRGNRRRHGGRQGSQGD